MWEVFNIEQGNLVMSEFYMDVNRGKVPNVTQRTLIQDIGATKNNVETITNPKLNTALDRIRNQAARFARNYQPDVQGSEDPGSLWSPTSSPDFGGIVRPPETLLPGPKKEKEVVIKDTEKSGGGSNQVMGSATYETREDGDGAAYGAFGREGILQDNGDRLRIYFGWPPSSDSGTWSYEIQPRGSDRWKTTNAVPFQYLLNRLDGGVVNWFREGYYNQDNLKEGSWQSKWFSHLYPEAADTDEVITDQDLSTTTDDETLTTFNRYRDLPWHTVYSEFIRTLPGLTSPVAFDYMRKESPLHYVQFLLDGGYDDPIDTSTHTPVAGAPDGRIFGTPDKDENPYAEFLSDYRPLGPSSLVDKIGNVIKALRDTDWDNPEETYDTKKIGQYTPEELRKFRWNFRFQEGRNASKNQEALAALPIITGTSAVLREETEHILDRMHQRWLADPNRKEDSWLEFVHENNYFGMIPEGRGSRSGEGDVPSQDTYGGHTVENMKREKPDVYVADALS